LLALVVLGVSGLVFVAMRWVPGDPARTMLGPRARAEDLARVRHELGLDLPLLRQYLLWAGRTLRGDLGRSISLHRPVLPYVCERFRATLLLAAAAMCIATLLGVTWGVLAAARPHSLLDRAALLISSLGVSIPPFWLGLTLIIVFALRLRWLPASGMYTPGRSSVGDVLAHLILPALTLAAQPFALTLRMTRAYVREALSQDYVRTARAKGLSEQRVLLRHALRNASVGIVTTLGLQTGWLLGGAVVVETVFGWPGVGLMLVSAISARDIPLVQGAAVLVSLTYVLINLSTDLLYARLDTRIRYG